MLKYSVSIANSISTRESLKSSWRMGIAPHQRQAANAQASESHVAHGAIARHPRCSANSNSNSFMLVNHEFVSLISACLVHTAARFIRSWARGVSCSSLCDLLGDIFERNWGISTKSNIYPFWCATSSGRRSHCGSDPQVHHCVMAAPLARFPACRRPHLRRCRFASLLSMLMCRGFRHRGCTSLPSPSRYRQNASHRWEHWSESPP
jgi:hypothetical protein